MISGPRDDSGCGAVHAPEPSAALLLASGGHHAILEVLTASLHALPPGSTLNLEEGITASVNILGSQFILGLRFAAPVVGAMMIGNSILGVMAKTVPQLNVLMMAFPLQIGIGLLTLALSLSLIAAFFAGEEDGLYGSKAFCDNLPVDASSVVAMLNMDMLGRGEVDEVLALGTQQNPDLEKVLKRAKKLKSTRIKKVVTNRGQDLFQRSDHYWFHKIGIPSLFFYEGWPESDNPDYHTWNDTIDKLDFEKITRSARLIYNTAWLLANDEERPSEPR